MYQEGILQHKTDYSNKFFLSPAGKLVGSTCAISGVLLIVPLLPIIYERWQRYYQLDQEGKRIRAGHKLLRDLQKKRSPPSTLEDTREPKRDNSDKKKKRERKTSETRERKTSETRERKTSETRERKTSETRERKTSETREKAKKPSVSSKSEKNGDATIIEERSDDDIVWTHIRRASIKRRESSQNLLRGSSIDGQNPPSKDRGSLTRKRPASEKSRKGKDIVANQKGAGSSREHEEIPKDSKGVEELPNISEKPTGNPVFHISSHDESAKQEKDWDEPGPSNVEY